MLFYHKKDLWKILKFKYEFKSLSGFGLLKKTGKQRQPAFQNGPGTGAGKRDV